MVDAATSSKSDVRRTLKAVLADMPAAVRHEKSVAACQRVTTSREFAAARVVMLFLSTPQEVDTSTIALRAWQQGKTVVVPKVSWNQRRMLPVEISSLADSVMTTSGNGIREPVGGNPLPIDLIDLVLVPGLGFTPCGSRIGRGMGFYDRFLSQDAFLGLSCGLAFEEQVLNTLPNDPHDIAVSMLATDTHLRRFTSHCIGE